LTISIDGTETKNKENLILPLSEPAIEALKKAMKVPHLKSPYVFCEKDGRAYYNMKVQRAFRRALGEAEIEDFRVSRPETLLCLLEPSGRG
jgi:integrase